MNVEIAKLGQSLRSSKTRFKLLGLIWIVLGMLAVGHVHNMFPVNAVKKEYYAVTFVPGSSVVWPPIVNVPNTHAHLWAAVLGMWIVLTLFLVVHFVVTYAEEIGRGIQNYERRIIEEREGGEATAATPTRQAAPQTQAQPQGNTPPAAQSAAQTAQVVPLRGRTIFELLSLEFLAEFVAEAIYSFLQKRKGRAAS